MNCMIVIECVKLCFEILFKDFIMISYKDKGKVGPGTRSIRHLIKVVFFIAEPSLFVLDTSQIRHAFICVFLFTYIISIFFETNIIWWFCLLKL